MLQAPFGNEEETFKIDQLTIENRLDRVQLYGSVEITRDKTGLEHAKELKALIDGVLAVLLSEALPDAIKIDEPGVIENPFS